MCRQDPQITVNRTRIDNIREYIYLVQSETLSKQIKDMEIRRRQRLGWVALGKLHFMLKNKGLWKEK